MIDYPEFHRSMTFLMRAEDILIDHDHVPEQLIFWVKFDNDSKRDFLSKLINFDKELYDSFKEYLEEFDFDNVTELIPIAFFLIFSNEEEYDEFFDFLEDVRYVIDIRAYTFIGELLNPEEDGEDEEDSESYPYIFSEEKEGYCYLTVFDWDRNEIEEWSGKFEKNDEEIYNLRLGYFVDQEPENVEINYPDFHKFMIDFVQSVNIFFEGYVIPQLQIWIKFDDESEQVFLEAIKEFDIELYEEFKDLMSTVNKESELVPLHFNLIFTGDKEEKSFYRLLKDLAKVLDIRSYSAVFQGSLIKDGTAKEGLKSLPVLFSEEKNGDCYLTAFDSNLNIIKDQSRMYKKDDEEIQRIRFPIFK